MAIPAVGISLYILSYLSADTVERKAVILFAAGMLMTILTVVIEEYIGSLLQKFHWLVYVGLSVVFVILLPFGIYHVVNASVPMYLSHTLEEGNGSKSLSRDVALNLGEYTLRFDAEF